MNEATLTRWLALCLNLGVEPRPHVYASLLEKYTSSSRHYHDLNHIENCLMELDRVKKSAKDPRLIELAIWFHDAVYDPERTDNEERSAEYAVNTLGELGLPEEPLKKVRDMIRATSHREKALGLDTRLLLDIDLSILGKPEKQYRHYMENIRKEYAYIPLEEYARHRIRFLRGLLERRSIYHTRSFRERYEESARRNMRHEIESLKQG